MTDLIIRKEIRICVIDDSDAISKIGYIETDQLLQIEFKGNGKTSYFANVPVHIYQEIINAKSVGEYFNTHIKDTYEEAEVEE
jgi:hypothetical protein